MHFSDCSTLVTFSQPSTPDGFMIDIQKETNIWNDKSVFTTSKNLLKKMLHILRSMFENPLFENPLMFRRKTISVELSTSKRENCGLFLFSQLGRKKLLASCLQHKKVICWIKQNLQLYGVRLRETHIQKTIKPIFHAHIVVFHEVA